MNLSAQVVRFTIQPDPRCRWSLTMATTEGEEITKAQLADVRRRISQVESGEAALIPGDEVLAQARNLLAEHRPSS